MKGENYRIALTQNARPFAVAAPRRVSAPLLSKVKEELDRLHSEGIIEPVVEPTDWCAPIVVVPRKTGDRVRLCVDYTELNKSIQRERWQLPTVEESLSKLEGGQIFSLLDATNGFLQVPLHHESYKLTTFITPFGRFFFKRLPFGINSGPEVYQKRIYQVLDGLDGVVNQADDILVVGRTQEEHDHRLANVLQRLREHNVTLNKDKCNINVNRVKFLGHLIENGLIKPDPEKVEAIMKMQTPNNVNELRQFLGMVNYLMKFIPNLAEVTAPLRILLKKGYQWVWSDVQKSAWDKIKSLISSNPVLVSYNKNRKTRVAADASSFGLGGVIEQFVDGKWKPITYASRSLSPTEMRYAQIEKEALALTWACERFSQYVLGTEFELMTDHKPLVQVLGSKQIASLSARLQRLRMRMACFRYKVTYVKGKEFYVPDVLSRNPIKSNEDILEQDLFVQSILDAIPCSDKRLKEIKEAQDTDEECGRIKSWIVNNNWNKNSVYWKYRTDLNISKGFLLLGTRLFIPKSLRKEILSKIHEGHMGIVKCRRRVYESKQWTFRDKVKTIDFVLVWDETKKTTSANAMEKRTMFENNLRAEGLELEQEINQEAGLHFVKIHAPLDILKRYAEVLKLQMPVKNLYKTALETASWTRMSVSSAWKQRFPLSRWFETDPYVFPDNTPELTAPYSRSKEFLFNANSPEFFTPAKKARIVQFILERTLYFKHHEEDSDVFEFGINRLLLHGVYIAAYPLHDGDLNTLGSMRYRFYHHWASYKNWYKYQPADYIMEYFGVKIALYFLWLGHYVSMLVPASVVGLCCFFISVFLETTSGTVNDACQGNIKDVICPLCDSSCGFWNLTDFCAEAEILYIFDNTSTVFFAIFISFWAAIYLETWKRYSAKITLRWDLTTIDNMDENPRPEYSAKLTKLVAKKKVNRHLNFITNIKEPSLSFWKHIFPGKVLSFATILLLIAVSTACLIGVTLYQMFIMTVLPDDWPMFATFTATVLNLLCIIALGPVFKKVARMLTEAEMHRTQIEFDNSFVMKLYLLQFVNNYSSIFYIAFFKGKFIGTPAAYHRVFGFRQLECTAGSCMLELTQQLAVIMIGTRAFRTFKKIIWPHILYKWRKSFTSVGARISDGDADQWEKDFLLVEKGTRLMVSDKLDMVFQYGFVTLFAVAFPLAPLFALINNIFTIRIDAKKLLVYHRRPTLRRTKGIGVWFDILNFVSNLAVFTNGFIIAFTSNFIPRMVYRLAFSSNLGEAGYLNYTLSYMAIKDLDMKNKPNTTIEYCRYLDFREPPWSENKYGETRMFWVVLAARFGFFIFFENIIMIAVILVKWLIPDIPQKVDWQMRRKHFVINETIINRESSQKSWWFMNWFKRDPNVSQMGSE
ncbi:anoctamin-4-like [Macrosteles quadrilineatus]|uniref:anoctamin-4-like n=2 Tax=Macrosteles quadrilineatus TaxID=74068 RepID=UPI0023E24D60|nr:anoctamin-4-like [Macrosteles quadrilineatus]